VWEVLIPHDGDGSAWGSDIHTDRQVEYSVYKCVWGLVKGLLDSGLGKQRPERPIRVLHFESKQGRITLPVNPHLNSAPFQRYVI
jgi:hypothetical protein